MAKKVKSRQTKRVKVIAPEPESEPESEEEMDQGRVTLAHIDAMSDDEEDEIEEWNAEAKALRQAIAEGAFDKIGLKRVRDEGEHEDGTMDDDEEDEEEDDEANNQEDEEEQEEEEDASDDEEEEKPKFIPGSYNMIGLKSVTSELNAQKAALPWAEKYVVVPSTPLPFGQMTDEGLLIDVHDDLKREVAFYNLALEAVHDARARCEDVNIPFSRPVDFFAEMVKTDGTFMCLA